ncbi:Chloride conductance regulatory protein ICln [Acorus gramineus]|uniref:Chloride conductance regulatory protein ICln n=1 Tax=Acorus gramineus TaxID=55184 RepID=A0AAV9ADY2_ACOGR|nr:Chloride conductance regulatory protein ICln [Acorus gramineus]
MALGLTNISEDDRNSDGHPRLDAENGEELMHVQPGVSIALGNRAPEPSGTLFISTERVVWLSDGERTKGYGVDFVSISLHAVSRDPDAYSSPCIYCQIDKGDDEESDGSDSECNEDLDLSKISEMRLIPSDPSQLDNLFNIFCECAALNPEPGEDDEEENEWIFGDEQNGEAIGADGGDASEWHFSENLANPIGQANGGHDLAHSVLELQINDQRFEDAEEMEHEEPDGHQ